jgi:hypothetical protein
MRSLLAVAGALLLMTTAAGGAAGAGAANQSDHVQDIGCDAVPTPDGDAYFYASISGVFGTDAYLDVWSSPDEDAELVWTRDYDRPVSMSFSSTSLEATIPLLPSGEAHIAATLEPAFDPSFTDSGKDANSHYRVTVKGTGYAPTGTLTLPGGAPVPFGAPECAASDVQVKSIFSQPHAFVRSFSSTNGSCELTNADGDTANVFLGILDEGELFFDSFVTDSGGGQVSAAGVGAIVAGSVSLVLDEYDPQTGDNTGGQGSADVSLTETGDDFSFVAKSSNSTTRVTGSLVDVEGALTTSLGAFDLGPCVITAVRDKEHTNATNGPKPGGKRPANDLPAGAQTLTVGGKASVSTKGAQVPSEAEYPCMDIEDFDGTIVRVPVEHTVWYKIAGTGRSITVDTAGSSYDTVVAVYAGSADASATVACLDDTPLQPFGRTLQTSVTFPTTVGTTYWVQIGGINEGVFGDDTNVPYGNLRVRVR